MDPQLWWFLARATGFVAWGLLTASVIWGLLLSTRLTRGRPTPAWLTDLHRFLGGAAVIFTALHVGGLVADSYTHFGLGDVLVPLASAWKPGPVALGVIALYLLISVELTSLLMRRMPRRWWKAIHLSSFGLFWIATLHLVTAGTDASNLVAAVTVDVAAASVVFLTLVRTLSPRASRRALKKSVREELGVGGADEADDSPVGDDRGGGELAVEQAAGLEQILGRERRSAVGH